VNIADDIYLTLDEISEGFYKEKGSKFLAFAQPCHSKAEAKIYLDDFRKSHPNACNVCFAWRFGTDQYEDRYSDDSEPNNSAGKPIFGQLIAANVTNVLIAVVRYYGGTNLGVGGLVTAYKTAAKEAMDTATIVEREITHDYEVFYAFDETGTVMIILNKLNANIEGQFFDNNQPRIAFKLKRSLERELLTLFEPYHTIRIQKK
jgi:uncharacterized YigZ family protein